MFKFCMTIFIVALTTCMFNINAVSKQSKTFDAQILTMQSRTTEQNDLNSMSCVKKEDKEEIQEIIHGAVENKDWMLAKDKEELHRIMSRYFTGNLLEELTDETWQFIKLSTDWYGTENVEKITFNSIDENMVRVLAYIKEYDVANESMITITGDFVLIKTDDGWRIQQLTIKE